MRRLFNKKVSFSWLLGIFCQICAYFHLVLKSFFIPNVRWDKFYESPGIYLCLNLLHVCNKSEFMYFNYTCAFVMSCYEDH